MVAELLVLALDYYRSPLLYGHLADPKQQLPKGFDVLLNDFCVALTPRKLNAAARALDTDEQEIQAAAFFFLRQVLLTPEADYYRVLGLSRWASQADIKRHYSLLVRVFHPDRSAADDARNAAFTARINQAYGTLRIPDRRRRYDERLEYTDSAAFQAGQPGSSEMFRPRGGVSPPVPLRWSQMGLPKNARSRLVWTLAVLALAVIAISIFRSSTTTLLRANPEMRGKAPAMPSFLDGSREAFSGTTSDASVKQSAAASVISGAVADRSGAE